MASDSSSLKTSPFSSVLSPSPAIATEKLLGNTNYMSWSKAVELWCIGQGLHDHLTTTLDDILKDPKKDKDQWVRVDALLLSLLWQSIDPSLHPIYSHYSTCYEVWTQAKRLYTNDIQRLYSVISNLLNLRQTGMSLTDFLGRWASLKAEYNSLLPPGQSLQDDLAQRDKFFMVCILATLGPDLTSIRDQILASPTIPSMDDVFTRLLCTSSIPNTPVHGFSSVDNSALVSQGASQSHMTNREGHGGDRGIVKGTRPRCTYCHRWGHTREKCYKLHGRPPRANIIQNTNPTSSAAQHPETLLLTGADLENYLQYQASQQSSSSTASFAHTGNSVACLTQSSTLGPWVVDSGASEHISGNPHLFSHFLKSAPLPSVTVANGSHAVPKAVGSAEPLPTVPLEHVLYIPHCPFNLVSVSKVTRALNCSIKFDPHSVVFQDLSTGQTIGTGCESQGLYYLTNPPASHLACSATVSPTLLHNRFGHPSLSKFQKMVPHFSHLSSLDCESCQLGKQSRTSFPKRVNNRAASPFAVVHSDIWGPSRVVSVLGHQYFVTFIDDYSRCTWLYLMKSRSELFSIFESFFAEIKTQFNASIQILRSDNAPEYFSTQFTGFLSSHGILHQSSCAYTPQQNGVTERKNRHLIETAYTLLLHHHVPTRFWADVVLTACYLINRMPSSVLQHKIPHTILFPDQPLYVLPLRVFGCTCFVHNMAPGQDKLSARSIKAVFLGYSKHQKGYKCYSPITRRYYLSPDVTFFESSSFYSTSSSETPLSEVLPIPSQLILPESIPAVSESIPSLRPFQVYHRRSRRLPTSDIPLVSEAPVDSSSVPTSPPTEALLDKDLPLALRKGNRATRNPHPLYNCLSYHRLSSSYCTVVSSLSSISVPKNVSEALSDPGWTQAMVDEMTALHTNGTWDLVPLPPGKSLVGCRWVYAIKIGPDGKIDRLKARLVAKGYTQVYGLDYGDTFSPVAKMSSVRLFISIAAMQHWPLYQLDIKNAFLHGELQEELYMEQPPGFVAQGESNLVCKLRRSLYGLKQSPRAWFSRFSTVLVEFGMIRSTSDHSVFYKHTSEGKCIYLIVYVDDIVITGNDQDGITQLKAHLFKHFQTKDLGLLRYFLGIEVAQSSSGIVLSQRKYVLDILEETGMLNCKPVDSPMDPNMKLLPGQGEPFTDPGRYRRLVGRLNYLTITRPDISFAVSVVSQFLQSPCTSHWNAVVRILRYVKSAPGKGLLYEDHGHSKVVGYSDADWAGSPSDRRSTSGYCILVGGNLVSWKSKKQDVVARSSAEAEYRAMALATCELIWLKQLLEELKFCETSQMELICDNQAALHIASNPVFHERTKHIEIDCHFIREKILSGCIFTSHVNSNDQLADILTKSLRGSRIEYIYNKLGAYDLYAPA